MIVAGTAQGALFLLIFRYVFGGAVAHTGGLSYVDFLVPGFVVTGVLFQGMGAASGIADDLEGGFIDRLRSLPIRLISMVTGRVGADTALVTWGVVVMTVVGFLVGFRSRGGVGDAVAGFGLTVLFGFAFVWVFITLGLMAGSPQAAQGLSFLVFPLSLCLERLRPSGDDAGLDAGIRHLPTDDADVQHRADPYRRACCRAPSRAFAVVITSCRLCCGRAGIVAVFAPLALWRLKRS